MPEPSLYRAAFLAAAKHCDEVVARLGDAHGEAARAEWNQRRFWFWALERVVEHVAGEQFWPECGRRNFARAGQRPKLQQVMDELARLRQRLGSESLPAFREKEALVARIAELANQLLE
ncbi:MAG: hypothetical protein HS108_09905 [Planctomycetes bacterium]|jgi:hypothetical protein|nr:hypothetical protein [Planctomycetota bacterium]MCL4728850.1 hypothetical protein [Planctomycetota bacterium]